MTVFASIVEVFVVFAILFFIILFPLLIIGLIFFVLNKNKKNVAAWQQISQTLGLHMPNPKKLEMKGVYQACELRIAGGARRSGGDQRGVETFTYCVTSFPSPLRFLLVINSVHGFFSKALSSNQMKTGNETFDQNFKAECYDRQVLQRLILSDFPSNITQNLLGDLLLAKRNIGIVQVSDHKIYLEKAGHLSDFQEIKQMLDTAAHLSQRFQAARQSFPLTDWEKSLLHSWQNLANGHNLSLDPANFSLRGNYGNFPLQINLDTSSGKWQTKIELKFPNSLMAGLKIMPENAIHKAMTWLGAQDIKTENKEFDDAFIVKAKNVLFAKHILTNDLCSQLCGLKAQTSDINISDEEISIAVDSVLGDEKVLKSYIEAIVSTAKMFLRQN